MLIGDIIGWYVIALLISGIIIGATHGVMEYQGLTKFLSSLIIVHPIVMSIGVLFTFPFLITYYIVHLMIAD